MIYRSKKLTACLFSVDEAYSRLSPPHVNEPAWHRHWGTSNGLPSQFVSVLPPRGQVGVCNQVTIATYRLLWCNVRSSDSYPSTLFLHSTSSFCSEPCLCDIWIVKIYKNGGQYPRRRQLEMVSYILQVRIYF